MRPTLRFPLALACIAALLPAAASAQVGDWQELPESPFHGYRFEDASFLGPELGWIVDGSGNTYRTTNAGLDWELMSTSPGYLRATAFTSPTHGWVGVLFNARRLYETINGGDTMIDATARISPPVSGGICGLWAVSESTVLGVGQYSGPAYVIRTTDGGATWQSTSLTGLAGSLIDVMIFPDGLHGLAVGGTGTSNVGSRVVVLATDNGGATWTQRYVASAPPVGDGEWGWKISFPTPLVGYVSVERVSTAATGMLLKTTDGGLTWSELDVPGVGNAQGVGFLTADRGWISGRGSSATTIDGGLTWTPTTTIDGSVNRFEFFGDSLGYAMGQHVFSLDARATTAELPVPNGSLTALEPVAPNPVRGEANFRYRLGAAATVRLAVFDVLGREVARLDEGARAAGVHQAAWDGRGATGEAAAPGVYVVRLVAGGEVLARPFVRIR